MIGLIPTRLLEREVGHRAITELVTTQDMFERKQQMIDRADAFVILPGGLGTLDELLEVVDAAPARLSLQADRRGQPGRLWDRFASSTVVRA